MGLVPHVFVVIPVHNRVRYTLACLDSLEAQTCRESMTVIVVDDGSEDATPSAVSQKFTRVQLLQGTGNLWWAGATNLGVRWALQRCQVDDYVLTMNNDTRVSPLYIESLTSAAAMFPNALIGSIAVDFDDPDRLLHWGTRLDWWWGGSIPVTPPEPPYIDALVPDCHAVDVLPGRGTLIPIRAFGRAGLFDAERLPQYAADYEFSRRANCAGFRPMVNRSSVVRSHVSVTGVNPAQQRLGPIDFLKSLVSIRSYASLRYRWRFARSCLPLPQAVVFFATSSSRVIASGIRSQVTLRRNHA